MCRWVNSSRRNHPINPSEALTIPLSLWGHWLVFSVTDTNIRVTQRYKKQKCVYLFSLCGHTPEDFKFNFTWCSLTSFDCILQSHSQRAPATDVEDLVTGLNTALLTGWGAWHHLQTVDALPFAANASGQLYT